MITIYKSALLVFNKYVLLFLSILILLPELLAQDHWNMELFGQYDRGDRRYSGSWGYTDATTGKEYALLGTVSGTAIYDITANPIEELAFIGGPTSNWREITVLGNHAYIVTEGTGIGEGMQVIDLSALPSEAPLVTTYTSAFIRGHIISRDIYSEDPFVYISGTCGNCGVEIVEVSEPTTPTLRARYNPGYYIHDCHVRGNYLYAAAFFEGTIDIVDISDKSNPQLVTQIETAGGSTHSCWTSEDERHLIISAESDGLPARIWNIEDLENIFEVTTYTANAESLTHNPYVRGDIVFFSHNTEGIRAVDIKDPSLPLEVGFYDTYEGPSGGFSGLWSACPYFPSGKIIGGNREDGLYVWTFNNTAANRVYLTIKDAITGERIPAAEVTVASLPNTLVGDQEGTVSWATLDTQMEVLVTAGGYKDKEISLQLEEGMQLSQEITLSPQSVAVLDNEEVEYIKLYPNPFKQQLTLAWESSTKVTQIVFLNLLNQAIHQYPVSTTTLTLATDQFPSGFYQLLLKDKEGRIISSKGIVRE